MTDTTKRYRLLKDWLYVNGGIGQVHKAGSELTKDSDNELYYRLPTQDLIWAEMVENPANSQWFELIESPVSERVPENNKVLLLDYVQHTFGQKAVRNFYDLETSKPIPSQLFPAIKQAIESALNDTVVEDKDLRGADFWHKQYQNLRSELNVTEELLNDRQRLLDAIPECEPHGKCVPHALEWIEKMKSQPTTDNAFVWTDKLAKEFLAFCKNMDTDNMDGAMDMWKQSKQSEQLNTGKDIKCTCTCEVGHPYNNLCCPIHGNLSPQPPTEKVLTDNSDVACLSLNDVMDIVRDLGDNTAGYNNKGYLNSRLHELLKQKLKNE